MKKMSRKDVMESILKDHNHSWYEDIYQRNVNNKGKVAMLFRDTEITYGEFFDMVTAYAKALKYFGINKGDEFVACLRQTPDYPVLVAAASLIGAKINLINADFNQDYLSEIIHHANASVVLVNDWDFVKMSYALHKSAENKRIVVLPVDKWDKHNNPYSDITDRFFRFDRVKFQESSAGFDNIVDINTFLERGKDYVGEVNGHGKLEDEIAVTYTSGSTSKGIHKGVVQRNQAYIVMGRYHDPEVAGIPPMENVVTLAAIGVQADTTLMTGVSDTLLQGGTVALEPIIDKNYFLYCLKLYHPGLAVATRTFWLHAMKQFYENKEFANLKLPYLYVPSEGGEPLSAGEEKALNRWLKKVKAGTAVTHTPFSVVKMTVGGGDSEHGSIFLSLYRGYQNYLQILRRIKEPIGLGYYDFVDLQVLREDGTYCKPMEMGRLVANSPLSMERYQNDPEASSNFFVTDASGKTWGDLCCYGYVDKWDKVYIKGRIGKHDPEIKTFQVADEILKDKNIMSCEVVVLQGEANTLIYVAHVEMQYRKQVNIKKTLLKAEKRCFQKFNDKLKDRLFFRVRDNKEGFPVMFTTKRNVTALNEEGLSEQCIVPSAYFAKYNSLTNS